MFIDCVCLSFIITFLTQCSDCLCIVLHTFNIRLVMYFICQSFIPCCHLVCYVSFSILTFNLFKIMRFLFEGHMTDKSSALYLLGEDCITLVCPTTTTDVPNYVPSSRGSQARFEQAMKAKGVNNVPWSSVSGRPQTNQA